MGQSISCRKCGKSPSINHIEYENNDINKYLKQMESSDQLNLKKSMEMTNYILSKTEEIEHIVGAISSRYIPIKNCARIYQYLCEDCYDKIDLEALPSNWGYKVMLQSDGWEDHPLPL